MAKFAVVLPAAGQSTRFKDKNYKKPFAPLDGRAVWLHSAERFLNRKDIQQLIVVIADEDREFFQGKYGANLAILGIEVAAGGGSRAESVRNALDKVRDDVEFVAVHDAARPVWADPWIDEVFSAAEKTGAAILGLPVTSTLKRVHQGKVQQTVPRDGVWLAQTPQVFRRDLLVEAYRQDDVESSTDDAELVQRLGQEVTVVQGSPLNLKITTRDDLKLAAHALKSLPKPKLEGGNPFGDDDMWR